MFRLTILNLCIFLMINLPVKSQDIPGDSAFLLKAKSNTIEQFYKSVRETAPVFQGREFVSYGQKIKGSPFFLFDKPVKGSLVYNGIEYAEISFAYDMVGDKVIISDYNGQSQLVAPPEKINHFVLGTHEFFRPETDIRFMGLIDTGFYEILYPGKTMVVAKKWKQVQYFQGEEQAYSFIASAIYYVYDQEIFRDVSSQKELLSIFKGQEKEIKKMLRQQKLSFKRNKEQSLIKAANYYDQLTK